MPRSPRKPRRAASRWRWALALLVVLALAALAGPFLVGQSPLPASVLAGVLPASAGRLEAGAYQFSWSGPQVVDGVALYGPEGETLFSAERVTVRSSLLDLITKASSPLAVEVVRPRIDLVVTRQGSNFDRVVEALQRERSSRPQSSAAGSFGPERQVHVRIVEGAVMITDATDGDQWLAEGIEVDLKDPGRGLDAIAATANGTLSDPQDVESAPAKVSIRVGDADGGGRLARAQVEAIPLAMLEPLLHRHDPTVELGGDALIEAEARWRTPATTGPIDRSLAGVLERLSEGNLVSSGLASLKGVRLRSAATRGGPVELSSIEIPWRLIAEGGAIRIQQFDCTSPIGRVAIEGLIAPDEVRQWTSGVAAAPRDLHLSARLDVGSSARVAPQLVRVRDGARVDSGVIETRADFQAGQLQATVHSGPLAGVANGRRVEWREPLDIRFAAIQKRSTTGVARWAIDSFQAESTFFDANASGDATGLEGKASFNLDQLARELAPLFDLQGVQLAGSGQAEVRLRRRPDSDQWKATIGSVVNGLVVGSPEAPWASEPSLRIDADLSGASATASGTVRLTAGKDSLSMTLPAWDQAAQAPFELRLTGDLARWWRRSRFLSPALPKPEAIRLAGTVDLSAAGSADAQAGKLDRFHVALKNLSLDTTSLGRTQPVRMQGERVEASARGAWRVADQAVRIEEATFISSVASARAWNVAVSLNSPDASQGEASMRMDLARLARWFPAKTTPQRYAASGSVEGFANIQGVQDGATIALRCEGRDLALSDRGSLVWSEPIMRTESNVSLRKIASESPSLALEVRDARVESSSLNGTLGGRIEDISNVRGMSFTGAVDYDLERLTPMLWPTLSDSVRIVGRDRATFRLETTETGSPDASTIARLRGNIAAPWEGANVFGLPVGAGRLVANLEAGTARLDPLDVAIGSGRLTASPTVVLDPSPGVIALSPGPLVTNVELSREVNERVLKFIAPVLADATRVDGRFSMSLSDFAVPLQAAETGKPAGRAAGVLQIHRVQVSPGPSVAEWVSLVQRIAGLAKNGVESAVAPSNTVLLAMNETAVEFQMVDGRIYHRGLVFYVGDARVESAGSVGVDETLDLVLSMPVLDEWIDKRPDLLGRLRGKVLQIPIRGTFNKPKIDSRAFQQLSSDLLESAAVGALEGGLNKLFEKLRTR